MDVSYVNIIVGIDKIGDICYMDDIYVDKEEEYDYFYMSWLKMLII